MPIPDSLSTARDTVLTPDLVLRCPSAVTSAWEALKAARGQPISLSRAAMLLPHHKVTAPGCSMPVTTSSQIDAAVERAKPAIHRQLRRREFSIRYTAADMVKRMIGDNTGPVPTGGDAA